MGLKHSSRLRPVLSELEHDVMQAVWDHGPATVEAVHAVVSRRRPLKETTIRTILGRLEGKGYLTHRVDGRAYVYAAVEPGRSVAARAVRQIIDKFCRGSLEELVAGLVDAKLVSSNELKTLAAAIARRPVPDKRSKKKASDEQTA